MGDGEEGYRKGGGSRLGRTLAGRELDAEGNAYWSRDVIRVISTRFESRKSLLPVDAKEYELLDYIKGKIHEI